MHSKREVCPEVEAELNEFSNMDNALNSVTCQKPSKGKDTTEAFENVQNHLEKLELGTRDLERTIERVFRRLIKTRVNFASTAFSSFVLSTMAATSSSFLRTSWVGITEGTISSCWLQKEMDSNGDAGGEEEACKCLASSSSMAALCSSTFKEVAFL
ncbi:hypothetical protein SDJN02_26708, partial [Cucurbita argyrosperma subsp. argyrosperma]